MGGSSTKAETTIPGYVEDAFKDQLSKAADISEQGYVPYQGGDVAGFTPQQQNAQQSASNWSAAFGGEGAQPVDVAASAPPQQTFSDGTTGYSSYGGYLENLAHMKEKYPGQYNYISSFAVDPISGDPFEGDNRGNVPEAETPEQRFSGLYENWDDLEENDLSFDEWLFNIHNIGTGQSAPSGGSSGGGSSSGGGGYYDGQYEH